VEAGSSSDTGKAIGGVNLEAVGEYNGQPITELDVDIFEDKPWRKPGADITDYFNYGFNEVTWRAYCAKQKTIRDKKVMKTRGRQAGKEGPTLLL
jgi:pre-mRNA 3'-end-processing factor FIP1